MVINEIVVILLLVSILLLIYYKQKKLNSFQTIDIDTVTKDILTSWFKRDEVLSQLKQNEDYIAIVVKAGHEITKNINIKTSDTLIQILFDKSNDDIVEAQLLNYKSISTEVLEMFSDTDMIVLS